MSVQLNFVSSHQTEDFVDLPADRTTPWCGNSPNSLSHVFPDDDMKKFTTADGLELKAIRSVEQHLMRSGSLGWDSFGTGKNVQTGLAIVGTPFGRGGNDARVEVAISGVDAKTDDVPLFNSHPGA